MGDAAENVHGTAIALGAHAVLIRGAPGAGKSDLALRAIAMAPTALIPGPALLVADDRVDVTLPAEGSAQPGGGKFGFLPSGPLAANVAAGSQAKDRPALSGLRVAAPATIQGKLEVRGIGIVTVPYVETANLVLVADLVASGAVERLPDPVPETEILGVRLPVLRLAPFEASAPVKLLLALAQTLRVS